jgi:hypothetical protein
VAAGHRGKQRAARSRPAGSSPLRLNAAAKPPRAPARRATTHQSLHRHPAVRKANPTQRHPAHRLIRTTIVPALPGSRHAQDFGHPRTRLQKLTRVGCQQRYPRFMDRGKQPDGRNRPMKRFPGERRRFPPCGGEPLPMSSCAAPAGSLCRTGRGRVAAQYHTARFRLVPRLAKALAVRSRRSAGPARPGPSFPAPQRPAQCRRGTCGSGTPARPPSARRSTPRQTR